VVMIDAPRANVMPSIHSAHQNAGKKKSLGRANSFEFGTEGSVRLSRDNKRSDRSSRRIRKRGATTFPKISRTNANVAVGKAREFRAALRAPNAPTLLTFFVGTQAARHRRRCGFGRSGNSANQAADQRHGFVAFLVHGRRESRSRDSPGRQEAGEVFVRSKVDPRGRA